MDIAFKENSESISNSVTPKANKKPLGLAKGSTPKLSTPTEQKNSSKEEVAKLREELQRRDEELQRKDEEIELLKQIFEEQLQEQEESFVRKQLASNPHRIRLVNKLTAENKELKAQLERERRHREHLELFQNTSSSSQQSTTSSHTRSTDTPSPSAPRFLIPQYDDDNFPPGEC